MDQEFPETFLGKPESLPRTPLKNLVITSAQLVNKEELEAGHAYQQSLSDEISKV